MSFFTVDKSKCCSDGICVDVCPIGILQMDASGQMPVPVEGAENLCINCGHCLAVCPQGAISLSAMPIKDCEPLRNNWNLSSEDVKHFLKGRRSIRLYKEQLVDRAIIEQLVDTARYAPSGINLQPVSWKIVYEPQKVQELAKRVIDWMIAQIKAESPFAKGLRMEKIVAAWDKGEDRICRKAPHIVIAYGLKDDGTAAQASTIALTYFELIAAASGLGACWAGYAGMAASLDPEVKKFLGLRSRENCFGAMMFGYPKYQYRRIPLRNPARISWA
ncbi:MAG: nitroreductase family protein [Candidatus Omnitrophica bacterium]|nr:nitroreductase family protein [Candidatus Omnitrophota bacterium]